jgi:HPr kinase/phosphorylase
VLYVEQLIKEFDFQIQAGHGGLNNEITDYSLKRPSAELVGFLTNLTPNRIQIYDEPSLGSYSN